MSDKTVISSYFFSPLFLFAASFTANNNRIKPRNKKKKFNR